MTDDAYRSIDAVSWSALRSMRTSAKQYRHDRTVQREDTLSLRIGRAVHTLILEPDEFPRRHPVYGGSRRGREWDAFASKWGGFDILTGVEAATAQNCAEAVRSHPVARRHLRDGVAERVIRWTDPETQIACKGRCDVVNGHLVEIKSTRDLAPHAFSADAARYGYHAQLAWYSDGLEESGYELHDDPAIVTVCTEEPHDVAVYVVQAEAIDAGRRLYRSLLARLAECLRTNRWPGIAEENELFLILPAWAEHETDMDITLDGKVIT